MNRLLGSACFVAASFGAGILGQEIVSRMVAAGDAHAQVRGEVAARWSDPREYYQHARLADAEQWQRVREIPQDAADPAPVLPEAQPAAAILAQSPPPAETPAPPAPEVIPPSDRPVAEAPTEVAVVAPAEPADPRGSAAGIPVASLPRDIGKLPTAAVVWRESPPSLTLSPQTIQAPADLVQAGSVPPPPVSAGLVPSPPTPSPAPRARAAEPAVAPPVVPPPAPGLPAPPAYARSYEHPSDRYLEPAELIRRQAADRAEQRRRRIELRKWLGYSAAHPPAPVTPMMSGAIFSPMVLVVPVVIGEAEATSE